MGVASIIMIRPGIWRRQLTSKVLVQLPVRVYKVASTNTSMKGDIGWLRTFHLVDIRCYLLHEN
jgi:hypothetical protein